MGGLKVHARCDAVVGRPDPFTIPYNKKAAIATQSFSSFSRSLLYQAHIEHTFNDFQRTNKHLIHHISTSE